MLPEDLPLNWDSLDPGESRSIETLAVHAIRVSHDATEPVGYFVEDSHTRVAIFTDLGEVTEELIEPVQLADLVILEANYDEVMLDAGSYPAHLKRRIRGPLGHLSNAVCAQFLAEHLTSRSHDVWLAHLSENNNRADIAKRTVTAALVDALPDGHVRTLPRHGPPVTWDSEAIQRRPRQIALPF